MRHTIHVYPTNSPAAVVHGHDYVHGTIDQSATLLVDRVANGEAFEGERRIRLPRRFDRLGAEQIRYLLHV
jgi:hypothetical protein